MLLSLTQPQLRLLENFERKIVLRLTKPFLCALYALYVEQFFVRNFSNLRKLSEFGLNVEEKASRGPANNSKLFGMENRRKNNKIIRDDIINLSTSYLIYGVSKAL